MCISCSTMLPFSFVFLELMKADTLSWPLALKQSLAYILARYSRINVRPLCERHYFLIHLNICTAGYCCRIFGLILSLDVPQRFFSTICRFCFLFHMINCLTKISFRRRHASFRARQLTLYGVPDINSLNITLEYELQDNQLEEIPQQILHCFCLRLFIRGPAYLVTSRR